MVSIGFAEIMAEAGVGYCLPEPYETGRRGRAYTDVPVACPGSQYPPQRPNVWLEYQLGLCIGKPRG